MQPGALVAANGERKCGLSDRFKYEHSVRTLALQSSEFSGLLVDLLGEVAEKLA